MMYGCDLFTRSQEKENYKVITIDGSSQIFNISNSYISFGSIAITKENKNTALMVSDGDLLYSFLDDEAFFYRYNKNDGLQLAFSADTVDFIRFYNKNKLVSLTISDETNIREWIENSNSEIFKDLRCLYIKCPVSKDHMTVIKRISEIKSDIGIVLEDNDNKQTANEVLSLFNPSWLVLLNSEPGDINTELPAKLKNIDLFWINGEYLSGSNLLSSFPGLTSLIIEDWDPQPEDEYQLSNLKKLRSLSIVESDISDLSSVAFLSKLKKLHLIDCDSLADINALNNFSKLSDLSLSMCENISDVSVISKISPLSSLSLPSNISQVEFSSIIDNHQSLGNLELVGCENINDLSPLEKLEKLITITLDVPAKDLTPLYQLKKLELIIVEENMFEESGDEISDLRAAMPDVKVVPGGGLCLGSGWILLIIPIILIIRQVTVLRNRFARGKNNR